MKAYVRPPAHLSRAMFRVANALERYAPPTVRLVEKEAEADVLVLHVIGLDAINYRPQQRCAVIQYCTNLDRSGCGENPWLPLWERARLVWSYYDLRSYMPTSVNFYHAPLGVDRVFVGPLPLSPKRDITVLTSGYVNGRGQEAIEEPTLAALQVGGQPIHVGPIPEGLAHPLVCQKLRSYYNIGDTDLAGLYRRTRWVAGLRFVEGFELGVIEGLVGGARPVVFDRLDNRHWFGIHARYVPECSGEELTEHLVEVFYCDPTPVTLEEQREIVARFNWRTIVTEFWRRVEEAA